MTETERKWEVWDEERVAKLASSWVAPLDLRRGCRHLIQRASSLVKGRGILEIIRGVRYIFPLLKSYRKEGRHWRLIQNIGGLIEGESILDVACGIGHIFSLFDSGFDYLGVDTSPAMVKKAKEIFPMDKDKFQFGDAYDLSSLPNFDTVVAIGLILHLPESELVIKQLWSKAKICVVLSAWVGITRKLVITRRGNGKEAIQRRETIRHLSKIFRELENLGKVEKYRFHNPVSGESNYIFKLWKKGKPND